MPETSWKRDEQGFAERLAAIADGGLSTLEAFELVESFGPDLVGNEVERLAAEVRRGANVRTWRHLVEYRCRRRLRSSPRSAEDCAR